MQKAACYVRVSTENQIENYSIDEQKERLKAYCKAKDFLIYKIYTDGGYSGSNTKRPALNMMLEDITQHLFNTVIVYKIDRLSRNQKDTLMLIEDCFLANNINFISVSENFDTSSPFGRAMIGILSVFAQLEKEQINERFTMGRIGRGKSGLFHGGGNAPKGYNYINGSLEINYFEAEQVKKVFELFLSGKSINSISKFMTDKYKNVFWNSANKVTNCIRNSIYIGKVKFKGTEYDGKHTPIISEDTYFRANELLNSSKTEKSNTVKKPFRAGFLLSGLIYCKKCGAKYSACHGYYKCYSRSKSNKKFIADKDCKNKNWKIDELDALISNEICKIYIDQNYNNFFKNNYDKQKDNIKVIKSEIEKNDSQINKLIDLFQISDMSTDIVKNKIETLINKKNLLAEILNKLKTNNTFKKIPIQFSLLNDNYNVDIKRMLVAVMIDKILIDDENVEIIWRIDSKII